MLKINTLPDVGGIACWNCASLASSAASLAASGTAPGAADAAATLLPGAGRLGSPELLAAQELAAGIACTKLALAAANLTVSASDKLGAAAGTTCGATPACTITWDSNSILAQISLLEFPTHGVALAHGCVCTSC